MNYSHAPILQQQLTPWEEFQTYVHQTRHLELARNGLRLQCDFRIYQVGIDIYNH